MASSSWAGTRCRMELERSRGVEGEVGYVGNPLLSHLPFLVGVPPDGLRYLTPPPHPTDYGNLSKRRTILAERMQRTNPLGCA